MTRTDFRSLSKVHEAVSGGVSVIGNEALQDMQTKFGQIVQLQNPNQSGYCPTPKKHFFCGMAKKLGCQFCAKK